MRYAQIRHYDIANGPGIRTVIFVAGCSHKCPGCFNEEYQDFKYGKEWTSEETKQVIEYLKDENIDGLTLLGGEPMENTQLTDIIRDIKKEIVKNIWIYSGYTYEEIIKDQKKLDLLKECDILVDGLFIDALKDLKLKFRGSSNQRIIDIKQSLKESKPILWELE